MVAIFCGRAVAAARGRRSTATGRQTRDFVYVGDVVDALLIAADRGAAGAFNVGTGTETSVLGLATAVREASDAALPLEHAAAREGEVLRSCLDIALARGELAWEPRVTLAEGLRHDARGRHRLGRRLAPAPCAGGRPRGPGGRGAGRMICPAAGLAYGNPGPIPTTATCHRSEGWPSPGQGPRSSSSRAS